MTDTHTHIYLTGDFPDGESRKALDRALESGVRRMILPGVAPESNADMLALHDYRPDVTAICAGLHPTELGDDWCSRWNMTLTQLAGREIVAIGETGIDLHWDASGEARQREAFRTQGEFALEHSLPLIIHSRDALDVTLDVLLSLPAQPQAVFHSFTGSPEDARRILEAGDYYFGINGVVTFKNAAPLREALAVIPPERLLLETDAPWLAPVPMRGRRNETSYLRHTAAAAAAAVGIDMADFERITDDNAARLFSSSCTIKKGREDF